MARKIKPLDVKDLSSRCNAREFKFDTTAELQADEDTVGQEKATEAIQYGLDIALKGYNIYVMGPPGLGKHTLTKKMVIRQSRLYTRCADWCYVYNFKNPLTPRTLKLPPGMGSQFQSDMDQLIDQLHNDFSESLAAKAIQTLKKTYQDQPHLIDYFDQLMNNINKHAQDFFNHSCQDITLFDQPHIETPPYSRLKVNLLVDNQKTIGSPVIYEDNPTYHNLIGRVENMHVNGSLVSDFTLIRPGALHRANSGYLILDVNEVLNHHLAWEGVKRSLHTQQIHIEPLEQSIEFWSSQTLDPQPIPLQVKVILIGDRETYYMLCEEEPDFKELFKVVADFNNTLPRTKANNLRYAKMISTICTEDHLKPLNRSAVASVIDFSARSIEDSKKLSTNIHTIKNIIQQADYWCSQSKRKIIGKEDIQKAIDKHNQRLSRIKVNSFEDIQRGVTVIETSGKKIGQVNALTIVQVGDYEFGQPTKVSATIYIGDGDVIDIQREIDQAGPIHSKGVLILSGYFKHRYVTGEKLGLSASLAFEQMYSHIDGDSASAAELCAILSALAHVPILQSIAITGAVNQFGDIQSVSSINEKIESFFHICKSRALTGKQGVIIPASNVQHLMLSEEVFKAVRANTFSIYAAGHVDQAMAILTHIAAGVRNKKGEFSLTSINGKIEHCLMNYAKCLKQRKRSG